MGANTLRTRYLRGMLEGLRENTSGADDEIITMMHKLDRGEMHWRGKVPPRKPRGSAPVPRRK